MDHGLLEPEPGLIYCPSCGACVGDEEEGFEDLCPCCGEWVGLEPNG